LACCSASWSSPVGRSKSPGCV